MDYLDSIGSLALGSRLRRLSDRLGQEVADVYTHVGVEFQPKWFPIFRLLVEQGKGSVTDIAVAIGITHPAVNQLAKEMTDAGLVTSATDNRDGRKRLLTLTERGEYMAKRLTPVWKALHCSISEVFEESDLNLLNAVSRAESILDKKNLITRYKEMQALLQSEEPRVIDFEPALAGDFTRLNKAWIEKYFCLEESDLKLFANPTKIVSRGGSIFFACIGKKVIGTCALIKKDAETFELVKMAVDEAYQGMGIGKMLMQHCLDNAKQSKAKRLILETNSRLEAAVRMYEKFGFQKMETIESPYARVDIVMELDLKEKSKSKSGSTKKQKAHSR